MGLVSRMACPQPPTPHPSVDRPRLSQGPGFAKTMESLLGVKSLDKAVEVQSEYAKAAIEGYVAHATKLGELYTNLAKETFKPYGGLWR